MGRLYSQRRAAPAMAVIAAVGVTAIAPAAAAPVDMTEAISRVEPGIARLDTTINYQHAIGAGTGIVIDGGGVVLTNFHVVQGADSIRASIGGGSYPADLVGYDRSRDIAVLQLRGAPPLSAPVIGDSSTLARGDAVVALGNASGSNQPLTQESGEVVGFGRTISAKDELTGSAEQMTGLIEFAAPVRAGDSGGPLVNAAGQVVGVTTAATLNFRMGPGGQGFAIPINDAQATASRIRSLSPSDGVHIGPPTLIGVGVSAREQQRNLPGVIIHEVLRGGPAERAGLHDGDVLLSIGGSQLDSANELTTVLDRHYPGDVVDLVWIDRAGEQRTGKATLNS